MDKLIGAVLATFFSSLIWLFILLHTTGNSVTYTQSETSTSNKNEIALYAEKFPEIAQMRIKAYEDKVISNGEYDRIRHHYNYLLETRGIINAQSLPDKK